MLKIGTTAVCNASKQLGIIHDYLNAPSINKPDEARKEDDARVEKIYLNDHKARIMIIAAASCFEQEIYEIVKSVYATKENSTLKEFIKKIMERKYFAIFDFSDKNKRSINSFYSLFGDEFKNWCKKREEEYNMSENIENFMLLNRLRNRLAHEGYDYNIGYSNEKIYCAFKKACKMLNWLSESLKEFEENKNKSDQINVREELI